jgi:hypothetical protein
MINAKINKLVLFMAYKVYTALYINIREKMKQIYFHKMNDSENKHDLQTSCLHVWQLLESSWTVTVVTA